MSKSSNIERLAAGAVCGFAATVPMSVVMLAWHRRLPWWQRYPLPPKRIVGDLTEAVGIHHRISDGLKDATTLASHFAYGACMGAVYPVAEKSLPGESAARGASYGFVVWLANYLIGLPAVGFRAAATREPLRRSTMMIASHLVWGTAVGLMYAALTSGDQSRQLKPVRGGSA